MRRTRRLVASAALFASAAACMIHLPSCDGSDGAHTYVGSQYIDGRNCLGIGTTVDVVPGPAASNDCDPICMVQPLAEGGHAVYIATMCPPYPQPDFDFSGKDPDCPLGLAALARNDFCLDDGGDTNPPPDAAPADAGADSD